MTSRRRWRTIFFSSVQRSSRTQSAHWRGHCEVDSWTSCPPAGAEAAALMKAVQKRLDKALAEMPGTSSTAPCETCQKLGNAINSYRTTVGNSQGDLRPLDVSLVRTGLKRPQLANLSIKISRSKWAAAQAEGAGDAWQDPRGQKLETPLCLDHEPYTP